MNAHSHIKTLPRCSILWGGTGQAKESRPIIERQGSCVIALFDDTPNLKPPFPDVPVFCGWEQFTIWLQGKNPAEIGFCIAIGNPHGHVRLRLADRLSQEGLIPMTIAHHASVIADDAVIDLGCQIMAGAVVDAQSRMGRQCIVNINSVLGHDSVMDDGSEVGPGATVCGSVHIGENAWIGAGATVYPRVTIGANAIVGIGSVVMKSVEEGTTVLGNPAKAVWKGKRRDTI
jgi:sugar O-acyltransferase (sialic acid O-acetyltransferase NeuD family)